MNDEVTILDGLIITPLLKARDSLKIALESPKTELNRDASIQRYEFTFELAWKTMKRVLTYKGILANNPRDSIREAAKQNLIDDPKKWFVFLENRNLTTHVYNEDVAEKIYNSLSEFQDAIDLFINNIKKL